ncbi:MULTISPECIES: DUF6262 family protein [unclassified Lysinibacillus]|uniref:DUF6262 family protein n=1 Tax=unclassified Lysinibacillus TaxID=2636778 RepID=UPI00087FD549|nr:MULTISPECIES: DUF6262 family protein [unclassified Lysinibacillus]SCY33755.1 hypothetical protein SAMN02787078_01273 [Lysinibacillus sp. SG9]SDB17508.1 hypothetical protein SAMN02787079_01275 [Lysinibacillus sp. TC-37]SFS64967.1 hypothetical protein SAMN02787087_01280 [Lysinibacillus sp. SG55]
MGNDGLRELQQKKREESIELVEWAIEHLRDLEGEHCRITAIKLVGLTGLSRATLYKTHLRPLWDLNWIKRDIKKGFNSEINRYHQDNQKLQLDVSLLKSKLEKSYNEISRLKKGWDNEKMRASVYRQDYEELKERYQQLLHHNLRVLRKLHLHGIDVKDLDLEEFD